MKYTEYTLQMEPGSKLFVYTDGVPEATNSDEKMFGIERTVESLNKAKDESANAILENVVRDVHEFVGDAEQFDDLTMMCIEYFGKPTVKELTMPASTDSLPEITSFVDAELESLNCPPTIQTKIDIAIDEIFGNIANYAYKEREGEATVRVKTNENKLEITLTFIDSGEPFNPLESEDPDTTLPADQRKIGGLGIYMVKNSMDDISYEYKDGHNILTIKKIIDQ